MSSDEVSGLSLPKLLAAHKKLSWDLCKMLLKSESDWSEEFEGLNKDGEAYQALMVKYLIWKKAEAEAVAYRNKLKLGIMGLWNPIRGLSRSHLDKYKNDRLIEIGKTLRILTQLLKDI